MTRSTSLIRFSLLLALGCSSTQSPNTHQQSAVSASSKPADVLAGTTSVGENATSAEAWGTGSTEVQAKIDAIRSALAKLQGNYVDVNTIVENDLIVKDQVLVWTRWPNLRTEVVGREVVAKVFRVKVRISNDIPSAPVDLVPREGVRVDGPGIKILSDAEVQNATEAARSIRDRIDELYAIAFEYDIFGLDGRSRMAGFWNQGDISRDAGGGLLIRLIIRLREPSNKVEVASRLEALRVAISQIASHELEGALDIQRKGDRECGPVRRGKTFQCVSTERNGKLLVPGANEESVLLPVFESGNLIGFDQYIVPKKFLPSSFQILDSLDVRLLGNQGKVIEHHEFKLVPLPYLFGYQRRVSKSVKVVVGEEMGSIAGMKACVLRWPQLKWGFQVSRRNNVEHHVICLTAFDTALIPSGFGDVLDEAELFISIPIDNVKLALIQSMEVKPMWINSVPSKN